MLATEPVLVSLADSLETIATKAVEKPNCRVLSVVDDDNRLVGLVPVRMLVNDIFLKIVPEEFLGEISDLGAALEYAQHIAARTAGLAHAPARGTRGRLARAPLPVRLRSTETVRTAFERMHHSHLNGLPILDDDNRVTGYLDQFELLLVWIQSTGRGALLRPTEESPTERAE